MKILVTLVSIIFLSFSAFGQSSKTKYRGRTPGQKSPWFHVTPHVGFYNGSFQKSISEEGREVDEFQAEGEATSGILLDYNSHRAGFALQTGLVLAKSNAVFKSTGNGTEVKRSYVDEYLSLPLAAKFYPFTTSARWFYFRAGVNISYLMSSKKKSQVVSSTVPLSSAATAGSSEELDVKARRSKADVQALAGLGIIVPISKSIGVTLEGTYHHGFINTDATVGDQRQELFTQGLSGIMGVSFAL